MSLCSSACRLLVSCAAIAGVFASCYGSERAQLAGCQEMRLRPGAGGLAAAGARVVIVPSRRSSAALRVHLASRHAPDVARLLLVTAACESWTVCFTSVCSTRAFRTCSLRAPRSPRRACWPSVARRACFCAELASSCWFEWQACPACRGARRVSLGASQRRPASALAPPCVRADAPCLRGVPGQPGEACCLPVPR